MREVFERLHAKATESRNAAHRAYTVALANSKGNDDTLHAYKALLLANQVKSDLYEQILLLTV